MVSFILSGVVAGKRPNMPFPPAPAPAPNAFPPIWDQLPDANGPHDLNMIGYGVYLQFECLRA